MALRDADKPVADGKFTERTWIIESAKEMQEWAKFAPSDADLPTTHERYVEHASETRGGVLLNVIRMGVRLKSEKHTEPDNLNAMDTPTLAVQAAKVGAPVKAEDGRAAMVQGIRAAKAKAGAA